MDKTKVAESIMKCAKAYNTNLEDKNLIFVFKSGNSIGYIETAFMKRSFFHLTGLTLNDKTYKNTTSFYTSCLNGDLSPDSFSIDNERIVKMKLDALPSVVSIHKTANMLGDYNFSRTFLRTDKLAGNVSTSLGFVRDDDFYVPNTNIKEDIRTLIFKSNQIVAILRKFRTKRKLKNKKTYNISI